MPSSRFDSPEEAEAAFYEALETGDATAMAGIWLRSPEVVCVHPGGPQLLGYEQVLLSWREILTNSGGFRLTTQLLHHHTGEHVSVRFLNEILFTEDETAESFTVLATNAYRRTGAGWRLVLHHASPPPRAPEEEDTAVEDDPGDERGVTLH